MNARGVLRELLQPARSLRARWIPGTKVFCVGRNKTGTTTLARSLHRLGYLVAPQAPAESLLDEWRERDFTRLIRFCRWYDAFQDIPFSLDDTFRYLDRAFPESKFVLSVRDSSTQWYESMIRFQTQKFGRNGNLPTWEDLQAAAYRRPGYMAEVHRALYGADPGQLYERQRCIEHYEAHNRAVREYFAGRPDDLLEINVAADDAYSRFCRFLGKAPRGSNFPRENVSQ